MGGPASSNLQQKFICRLINVLQYLRNCTLQKFGNGSWIMFTYALGKILHHINNLHQNIKLTLEQEGNGEQAFLGTLLNQNNRKISVVVYRKPTYTDQYLQYSSHHETSWKKSVASSLSNIAYSIIPNDYLYKENARIKQVLKENGKHF